VLDVREVDHHPAGTRPLRGRLWLLELVPRVVALDQPSIAASADIERRIIKFPAAETIHRG
jgi:hypothetical protein